MSGHYSYIRFIGCYDDPAWGKQAIQWFKSPLIRVWRSRFNPPIFEWVGHPKRKFSRAEYAKQYPLVMAEGSDTFFMSPKFPADKK